MFYKSCLSLTSRNHVQNYWTKRQHSAEDRILTVVEICRHEQNGR